MREQLLDWFFARLEELRKRFDDQPSIVEVADMISAAVRARFTAQNNGLAQIADYIATGGDHTEALTPDRGKRYPVEKFYEELLSNIAVAQLVEEDAELAEEQAEEGEDVDEEEEDERPPRCPPLAYHPGESRSAIETWKDEVRTATSQQDIDGIGG
jgi:hypothetical protein